MTQWLDYPITHHWDWAPNIAGALVFGGFTVAVILHGAEETLWDKTVPRWKRYKNKPRKEKW